MDRRKLWSLAGAYIIIGLLVFGWCYNHPATKPPDCPPMELYGGKPSPFCIGDQKRWRSDNVAGSLAAGALWPIVGGLLLSIQVTRWP